MARGISYLNKLRVVIIRCFEYIFHDFWDSKTPLFYLFKNLRAIFLNIPTFWEVLYIIAIIQQIIIKERLFVTKHMLEIKKASIPKAISLKLYFIVITLPKSTAL